MSNVPRETRTRVAILLEHMEAGRYQEALRLAVKSRSLGEHRNTIHDAHNAYHNPRWCESLGLDPLAVRAAGHAALRTLYLK